MTEPGALTHPSQPGRPRSRWSVPAIQAGITLVLFAGAGVLCGLVWWKLWSPAPNGIAFEGEWVAVGEAATAQFAATGWYVVVAVVAGLVIGALAGLFLDRAELVTLVAVAAGSVLAAWLTHRVGVSLGPPDPEPLARVADNGTEIPSRLNLEGLSPYLAFPVGAMAGLAIALFGFSKPRRSG